MRACVVILLFLLCPSLVVRACWFDPSCPKTTHGCVCIASKPRAAADKCCCIGQTVQVIPANLSANMNVLIMCDVGIERIAVDDFAAFPDLEQIDISDAKSLISVDAAAFEHLTKLRKLKLSDCPKLREIEGTLLEKNPKMDVLTVTNTGLERMPNLHMISGHSLPHMQVIDFSHNRIQNLSEGQIVRVYTKSFLLNNNKLSEIGDRAFKKCMIADLDLSHNRELTLMSKSSFAEIAVIHNLNLSDTAISELPTEGIKDLKLIAIEHTHSLKQLPSILAFTNLQEAKFTYPYHCCLFKHAKRETARSNSQFTKNLVDLNSKYCGKGTTNGEAISTVVAPQKRRRRQADGKMPLDITSPVHSFFDYLEERWGDFYNDTTSSEEESEEEIETPEGHVEGKTTVLKCNDDNEGIYRYYENITCTPHPNALNPCEDVVGYSFLRVAIWLVWMLAIVGNIGVWIVLVVVRHPRMRVHYFFMMNLALADLMTGVYLAMLAIQDIKTSGEYYNHAVEWQTGMGCKVAGFISVFASELSIITMFLISFEIWYNTKYIFYGKRLPQSVAYILMSFGYLYAILMATLPLLGVSSYAETSICLPLAIGSAVDRTYIVIGLLFNVLAFIGMATNYGMIYCTVNGSASPSTRPEDIQVAKKMAFLIGTDFLCWCPTIFFGLTAALKMPLISISVAKIFLVLFYPINAFTNPFLYVFFTKIIRTDIRNIARRTSWYKKISEVRSKSPTSKTSNTLNHFYHTGPPGSDGRKRQPSNAQSSTTFLQVTQSTSVGSTPRGSNCSSNARNMSGLSLEALRVEQSSLMMPSSHSPHMPRVSFNEDVVVEVDQQQPVTPPKRKSFPIKPRVSAVPQMSDISEHSHSSDSTAAQHDPKSPSDARPLVFQALAKSLVDATSLSNGTTIRKKSAEQRPLVGILTNGSTGRRKRVSDSGESRVSDGEDEWWRRQSASGNDRQSSLVSSGFGSMRADSESSEFSQRLEIVDPSLIPLLSMGHSAHNSSLSIESGYAGTPDGVDRSVGTPSCSPAGRTTPILTVSNFSVDINDMAQSWV